jgi:hypothetical protein
MPKFRVKVTTEALVTTYMEIEAPTEDDAIEEAATQARENGGDHIWAYDGLIEDAPITATL